MVPLVVLTLLLGVYPAPVLDVAAVSVKKLVSAYEASVQPAPAVVKPAAVAPTPSPAH
jgi:NADH-quinone oxidoreductase subunit M